MSLKFHKGSGEPSRFVGVELECFGISKPEEVRKVLKKYGAIYGSDCSIVGDNSAEIKTAPACGDKFIEQIREITEVIKAVGGKVNDSCGTHIHIDARDFKFFDLLKIYQVWAARERMLTSLVAEDRRGGEYCESWEDKGIEIPKTIRSNSLGFENFNEVFEHYTSLNLGALADHGTLENRLLEGTLNPDKIIAWAQLNSRLVDSMKTFDGKLLPLKKLMAGIKVSEIKKDDRVEALGGELDEERDGPVPYSGCQCDECQS